MLELFDWEFKITMINMLRSLKNKVDSIQNRQAVYQRDGNSKKKRIKKKCQRSKTPLQKWRMLFISSRVDWTAEETITEFSKQREKG